MDIFSLMVNTSFGIRFVAPKDAFYDLKFNVEFNLLSPGNTYYIRIYDEMDIISIFTETAVATDPNILTISITSTFWINEGTQIKFQVAKGVPTTNYVTGGQDKTYMVITESYPQ